jgi:hypothetical protein
MLVKKVGYNLLVYGSYCIIEVASLTVTTFGTLKITFQMLVWVNKAETNWNTYELEMLNFKKRMRA